LARNTHFRALLAIGRARKNGAKQAQQSRWPIRGPPPVPAIVTLSSLDSKLIWTSRRPNRGHPGDAVSLPSVLGHREDQSPPNRGQRRGRRSARRAYSRHARMRATPIGPPTAPQPTGRPSGKPRRRAHVRRWPRVVDLTVSDLSGGIAGKSPGFARDEPWHRGMARRTGERLFDFCHLSAPRDRPRSGIRGNF